MYKRQIFTKRFDSKTVFIGGRIFGVIVDVVFFFAGFENVGLTMFLYSLTDVYKRQLLQLIFIRESCATWKDGKNKIHIRKQLQRRDHYE